MLDFDVSPVIAAVRTKEELLKAFSSEAEVIFYLTADIMTLASEVKAAHDAGKKLFVHIDLAEGIGKDKCGLLYAKSLGIDGVISTRVNIIKMARELGLVTVQRFFIVDSRSVDTTVEAIKASKPDMVEVMPGVITKIISRLCTEVDMPVIAGGLIEEKSEIISALRHGAAAVSVGKCKLWNE